MLGLRRWHKTLLVAELLAAGVVVYGYRLLTTAHSARTFGEDFGATVSGLGLLWPGLWILRPGPNDSIAPACLLAFAIYTLVFFGLLTAATKFVHGLKKRALRGSDSPDLSRYLR